jgi:hypothetical protein
VGQELDLLATCQVTPCVDVQFGYSHLFYGNFLINQLGSVQGQDFYYGQMRWRF